MAGIFDGEGCFCIYTTMSKGSAKYPYYILNAVINIREKVICDLFQKEFGGHVSMNKRYDKNHSPTYIWKVSAKKLRAFVEIIKPYLILKRKQAEVIESFYCIRPFTTIKITSEENARMEEHRLEMRRLNMSGVGKDQDIPVPELYVNRKLIPGENYTKPKNV